MSSAVADASEGGDQPGIGSSKRAPRGAACLNCRRRKMRCDGIRPVCGQCTRNNREVDCEYTDGTGPSPTQVLEDQIARLEARIREIEHPDLMSLPVNLNPARSALQGPNSEGLLGRLAVANPTQTLSGATGSQGDPRVGLLQDYRIDPSQELIQTLVNTFIPYTSSLNFFLHIPRFMQAVQLPIGDPRRAQLSPALLNAVFLWGAHLSTSNAFRDYESVFLTRTTTALSSALRDSHYTVIHLIQAEVLIANYFFSMSRFLEGRYHCSAAVALALSCRLTKLRSGTNHPSSYGHAAGGRLGDQHLPPPRDSIEEGERIRGFWFVYALDKSWAVALGSPPHFDGTAQTGLHIDTPWPLEMAQFEAGGMPMDYRSSMTVINFLTGGTTIPASARDSQLSLRAKAATLFERATHLASQWSIGTNDRNDLYGRIVALDGLIDRFTVVLPPLNRSGNADAMMDSLVTHTLARAATIQLRSSFRDPDGMNDGKDIFAAEAATALLDNLNVSPVHVDPILAILWTAVCRVFIAHGNTLATAGSGSSSRREAPRALLGRVLAVMNRFREASPLMGTQYAEVCRRAG